MSDSLKPHGLQYARLPCPQYSPRVCSNSCPWSQWCHPTISSLQSSSFGHRQLPNWFETYVHTKVCTHMFTAALFNSWKQWKCPSAVLSHFRCVWLCATIWTVVPWDPLSMGFFRQGYWRRLSCLSPGDLPNLGLKPGSPVLQVDSLLSETLGKQVFQQMNL